MEYLSEGANSWQLTAATLVGLMSIPGLVVLYGGVMQKRWSVNSMMMAFVAFAIVLVLWVLVGFKMAFGDPMHIFGASSGFFGNMWGKPGSILNSHSLLDRPGSAICRKKNSSSRCRPWPTSRSSSPRSRRC
jgi:Amt family ammonium transporter